MIRTVPSPSGVTLTTTGDLRHRCPYKDEADYGEVEIQWTTETATLELHSLAAWLVTFATVVTSHEDLTEEIRAELSALDGISDVRVKTTWETAGMDVVCKARGESSALLRESVRA